MGEQIAVEVIVVPYKGVLEVLSDTVQAYPWELLVECPVVITVHEDIEPRNHAGCAQKVRLCRKCEAVVVAARHILFGMQAQSAVLLAVISCIAVGEAHLANHAVAETRVMVVIAGIAIAYGAEDTIFISELIVKVQTALQ